jgi:hypothetical protein
MDDLCKLIMQKRGIRETSATQYCNAIFRILRDTNGDSNIFTDYSKIVDYVNKQNKTTSKRNIVTAVVVYLRANDLGDEDLFKKYNELLKTYSTEIDETIGNGKKTDGQNKNWASWDEILTIDKKFKLKLKGVDKDSDEYKELYQDYLIYSLYTIIPPLRNDYAAMTIYTPKEYKAISEKDRKTGNYLVFPDKFVINEYKTSDKYGQIVIELKDYPNVVPILKGWLKLNKTKMFLIDKKDSGEEVQMSPLKLTKRLNRIFKYYLDKNISTSILRHSYLSSKYSDTLKERRSDSEIMGHNLKQQDQYIKE